MKDTKERNKIVTNALNKGLWSWETEDLISIDGEMISLNISEENF